MFLDGVGDTTDVVIPKDPLRRVIGQSKAVEKVKIAVRQRRHLLLVGPPGIGKSMLAQAVALSLPKPQQEIRVLHNPQDPERPLLEVVAKDQVKLKEEPANNPVGEIATPQEVPGFISEQLGFRCPSCGTISSDTDMICPRCGINKYASRGMSDSPFGDIITEVFDMSLTRPEREVESTQVDRDGNEKVLVYRKIGGRRIQVIDKRSLATAPKKQEKKLMKVIVPFNRIPFVQATGGSETELLGDVRHDPFGSHPEIGTPAYQRVIAGAIHEAHEGVLFIDELPQIQKLQKYILTAMQEKRFPIVGRNPHSAGASVKVNNVPCDFVFIGACNITDLQRILPPLRSRIIGGGYEILLDTTMQDNDINRFKIAQFMAQEIETDKRIPHANREAIEELVKEARRRASSVDGAKGALTLRFRDLSGIIRYAGDLAIMEETPLIEKKHITKAISEAKPVETQIQESYGSLWKGMEKDSSLELDDDYTEGYL